jgi:hypothetical protein
MSWSVSAIGKPAAVKAALVQQFESARNATKHFQHEQDSVRHCESIINGELDFLAARTNPVAVRVEASGSAYSNADGVGSTQVKLEVTPLYGFVE